MIGSVDVMGTGNTVTSVFLAVTIVYFHSVAGGVDEYGEYRSHTEAQLTSRKKVAKMLIAIVCLFAACYLPVNLIFALR